MTAIIDPPVEEAAAPSGSHDPRIMAVLAIVSRYGVRLPAETMKRFARDIVAEMERLGVGAADDDDKAAWKPVRDTASTRKKNPRPGVRTCSMCHVDKPTTGERPGGDFVRKHNGSGSWALTSRCRDCLNLAQRSRYLSARKLEALNQVRLEFVADAETAGLRCLDCCELIAEGDEVVARSGIRHNGTCDPEADW